MKMQGIAAAFIAAMLPVLAMADEVQVRVTYYSPEIVRIEKTMSEFRTSPSVSVVMEPQDGVNRTASRVLPSAVHQCESAAARNHRLGIHQRNQLRGLGAER